MESAGSPSPTLETPMFQHVTLPDGTILTIEQQQIYRNFGK